MTDIQDIELPQDRMVPVPGTGELVSLDAETDDLARVIQEVRDHESELRELKAIVGEEIHRRFDANAKWSDRTEHFEIKGESPNLTEVDVDALRATVADMVERGWISQEAADAAVRPKTTHKESKRGMAALSKLGGEVAERIAATEKPIARPRRLTVKRVGQ